MKIILIAAMDLNYAIGYENKLLWHLPNDLQHFKRKTVGKTVVMGRKTFESLGRLLPNRENLILSRNGLSFDAVLNLDLPELWVIGGAQIYTLFLPHCTEIHLTRIHTKIEGADTHFPDFSSFTLVERVENKADERHVYDYDFERWVKS